MFVDSVNGDTVIVVAVVSNPAMLCLATSRAPVSTRVRLVSKLAGSDGRITTGSQGFYVKSILLSIESTYADTTF